MEVESFSQPEIIKTINNRFVPIRVDVDKEKSISRAYFVRGLPTSWFLDSDGSRITNIPGYVNPETFLIILKYIDSESYKSMTFKEYMRSQK